MLKVERLRESTNDKCNKGVIHWLMLMSENERDNKTLPFLFERMLVVLFSAYYRQNDEWDRMLLSKEFSYLRDAGDLVFISFNYRRISLPKKLSIF